MEMYCRKMEPGKYRHFSPNRDWLRMFGVTKEDMQKVRVEKVSEGEGTYWGYEETGTGRIKFIFGTRLQVEMCSPDGFKREIKRGQGNIVNLRVEDI